MPVNNSAPAVSPSAISEFRRGLAVALPMLLGIIPFALVLGAKAAEQGLSLLEVPLLTGSNFAGGSEFAILEVWSEQPSVLMLVLITLLVNSRHLMMGATLAPYIGHLPTKKLLPTLFFMCDESWAVGLADAQRRAELGLACAFSAAFYAGLCTALYSMWVIVTTAGAALGPVLGDIKQWGFDLAFPAVFLVLLAGMWRGPRAALPWLVSLVSAACAYLWLPQGWYVPVGAVSGLVSAWYLAGFEQQASEPTSSGALAAAGERV